MNIKKLFQSLQFKLIDIVLAIFIIANVVIVSTALSQSTKSTGDTVEQLLDSVTESVSAKIKAETDKQFRMLEALAMMDFIKKLPDSEKEYGQKMTDLAIADLIEKGKKAKFDPF